MKRLFHNDWILSLLAGLALLAAAYLNYLHHGGHIVW